MGEKWNIYACVFFKGKGELYKCLYNILHLLYYMKKSHGK